MIRPVDYALVYRLEDARYEAELRYICPMRDWVMDFRDHFVEQGWWERMPTPGFNGSIWTSGTAFYSHCVQGEISGEIPWR